MSAKELSFGDEARQRMARGASILAQAFKATLGPRGRNVVIQKSLGGPAMTKDGVSVAKEIEVSLVRTLSPFEEMGR